MKKVKRKKPLLVFLTHDEREYLARLAAQNGYSMATIIRTRTFRPGWTNDLQLLRQQQSHVGLNVLDKRHSVA